MGRWGVILDAGSSGTRVHVYRWLNTARARHDAKGTAGLKRLPELTTTPEYTKKVQPGVSTFADNPLDVGPHHLQDLFQHALDIIPENQIQDTPIFLMATAGVRLLEPAKQRALLNEICSYTKKKTKFSISDCDLHIQVISGETEGLYGWVAANYLSKAFDVTDQKIHSETHHTYGFLDMGGASAQIAFVPNVTETEKHANDLKLIRLRTLNGDVSEYKVFTTTWLGFGVNLARERYVTSLIGESYTKDPHEILDPCLPSGLKTSIDGKTVTDAHQGTALVGTGLFDECLRKTYPLLDKDAPCIDQPCLLHGQHVPAIDWDVNNFVGVSEYWYTTQGFFNNVVKNSKYNFASYQKMVRDYCSEEWEDIKLNVEEKRWGNNIDYVTAQKLCFKASWLMSVLHDGIGVPRTRLSKSKPNVNQTSKPDSYTKNSRPFDSFQAVNQIGNMEVSWTLGKMVLYASGQIPPSDSLALPVGFGPNLGGPESFQEAGSNFELISRNGTEDTWTEAAEELAEKAQSQSTHSLLIFMLIIMAIWFFFRKRDKRLRLRRAARRLRRSSSPVKVNRGFLCNSGKYLGSLVSVYHDKSLDEEESIVKLELGEVETDENNLSDSYGKGVNVRGLGQVLPKVNVVNVDSGNIYFDGTLGGVCDDVGLGVSSSGDTNAFHRAGLAVRTESRDRSTTASSCVGNRKILVSGRSRAGSPTRGKSPLLSSLEEI
ncbi:Golgi apyrase [Golovinomyces cichoracearum]|uniref:Golgi apyrase n=1 Tax=Golovinomyces cichoracearum TaxID=62708 RepID=A0A420IA20_9PEZI|nr:Golgi apyrase [Golovinomyces cichoracearum]